MPPPPRAEQEVRRSLARTVAVRWPHERLLFTSSCGIERTAGRAEWFLGLLGRAHCPGGACTTDITHRSADGIVGVTQARLLYQERARHGTMARVAGAAFGLGAAIVLVSGGSLERFALAVLAALALWATAKAAEAFGVGSGYVEFSEISAVQRREQRIEAFGRWGTGYRLHVPDPTDFRTIAALVASPGEAGAA